MSNPNEPTTFEEAYELFVEYRERFERLEIDFDEYQQSSLTYEKELEVQLNELNDQLRRLQQDLFFERTQNEKYRERSEQTIKQFDKRHDQIQEELNSCKKLNEKLTQYIRELEQTNDDLERSKRTLLDSLSTFENKLNRALEQNALLENELDEKQQLTETVQRLRDETRELQEELAVLHKTNREKVNDPVETPIVNSNRMQSILSEAAAINNSNTRQDSMHSDVNPSSSGFHEQKKVSSTSTPPKLSTTRDFNRIASTSVEQQTTNGNEFYPSLSTSTRLECLKLIDEAFRRFMTLESTLLLQRKQSQATSSIYNMTRSRFNSMTKPNESSITQTFS